MILKQYKRTKTEATLRQARFRQQAANQNQWNKEKVCLVLTLSENKTSWVRVRVSKQTFEMPNTVTFLHRFCSCFIPHASKVFHVTALYPTVHIEINHEWWRTSSLSGTAVSHRDVCSALTFSPDSSVLQYSFSIWIHCHFLSHCCTPVKRKGSPAPDLHDKLTLSFEARIKNLKFSKVQPQVSWITGCLDFTWAQNVAAATQQPLFILIIYNVKKALFFLSASLKCHLTQRQLTQENKFCFFKFYFFIFLLVTLGVMFSWKCFVF